MFLIVYLYSILSTATVWQYILVEIELTNDTNTEHKEIDRKVTRPHLADSYLNADTGIVTIMTDVNDRWHFFWLGKMLLR